MAAFSTLAQAQSKPVAETKAVAEDTKSSADPKANSKDEAIVPQKTAWSAAILVQASEKPIATLEFPEKTLPVQLIPRDDKLRPFVELKGTYQHPGWTLFVQSPKGEEPVRMKADSKFQFYVILTSRYSNVNFIARGPNGEVESNLVQLFSPEAQEYRIGTKIGDFTLNVGGGSFKYFQTGFGNFASKNAVQEIGYRSPPIFSNWGIIASLKAPVWTVSSSPIEASPDLIRANLDAVYRAFSFVNQPISVELRVGFTYLNLLSYDAPFGFNSLYAPDMGIGSKYVFNDVSEAFLNVVYSPLGGLFGAEKSWEIQTGYRMQLANLHHINFNISYVSLGYIPMPRAEVRASLLSLMAGYEF
ncbi:MAG: hypothetical protein ABIR96_09950 [Bdellovibrionota bacterium]